MSSPKVKVLKYLLSAAKVAQRTKDPRERLAALKFEIEFTERLEKAEAEGEPSDLPLAAEETASFEVGGGE